MVSTAAGIRKMAAQNGSRRQNRINRRNDGQVNGQTHKEGPVAKAIEQQTSKLPSDTFLWIAGAAMATSATLHFMGRREDGQFVGQWAAPLLVMGLYNKIVKLEGSDGRTH